MHREKILLPILLIIAIGGGSLAYNYGRAYWVPVMQSVTGKRSVSDVIAKYGFAARARLVPDFQAAGIDYPPETITLLAIKDEARLELWAGGPGHQNHIRDFPIQALSGVAGPKLREGDKQVPEGHYRIEGLNPNSAYHLSMKLNYPNAFDLKHAQAEGRHQPGSNIFIHGKAVSIGCLAMGDPAIEELFTLVADIGRENVEVLIAPTDPREAVLSPAKGSPEWVTDLYLTLTNDFASFPRAASR